MIGATRHNPMNMPSALRFDQAVTLPCLAGRKGARGLRLLCICNLEPSLCTKSKYLLSCVCNFSVTSAKPAKLAHTTHCSWQLVCCQATTIAWTATKG